MTASFGLRRSIRLPALVTMLLGGLVTALSARLLLGAGWYLRPTGSFVIRNWARLVATLIGLRIRCDGDFADGPCLIASNHVSWLDIIALRSRVDTVFVAKDEVRSWPVVGWLVSLSGTRYIERGSRSAARRSMLEIDALLRRGGSATVFPEGTTSAGDGVLRFHSAVFQAAVNCSCPVQPVTLNYRCGTAHDRVVPYINDDTFLPHLLRVLAQPRTELALQVGPVIAPPHRHRSELAATAHDRVAAGLADAAALDAGPENGLAARPCPSRAA
jgi:1-acyl-sn-glycerol-3-phosphate acyltransferase